MRHLNTKPNPQPLPSPLSFSDSETKSVEMELKASKMEIKHDSLSGHEKPSEPNPRFKNEEPEAHQREVIFPTASQGEKE
jgi:hypothetical protein